MARLADSCRQFVAHQRNCRQVRRTLGTQRFATFPTVVLKREEKHPHQETCLCNWTWIKI